MRGFSLVVVFCGLVSGARADAPSVVTDIPPVQSLVAQVMRGVGEPELILPPGASPHGYAMRPSEAAALQRADLVVWIGDALTPWLGDAIADVSDAESLVLADVEGTERLAFREVAVFAIEGEGAHEDDHGHGDEQEDAHAHAHGGDGTDPHLWLEPENARLWLRAVAEALGRIDPENAETYRQNAEEGRAAIEDAVAEARDLLREAGDAQFIVLHDAFQYFEHAFDLPAAGAIAASDAAAPGPARVRQVQDAVQTLGVACVLGEPGGNVRLAETVSEGTGARFVTLDPLGAGLEAGPGLYPALIVSLAEGLQECLS